MMRFEEIDEFLETINILNAVNCVKIHDSIEVSEKKSFEGLHIIESFDVLGHMDSHIWKRFDLENCKNYELL